MKRLLIAISVVLMVSPAAGQDDGFSFEMMEPEVKEETKQQKAQLEQAKNFIAQGNLAQGLPALEEIIKVNGKNTAEAEYAFAKAMQRQGYLHGALDAFERILLKGQDHPYYENSRRWVFFIAQEIQDKSAAFDLISVHANATDVPEKNRGRMQYALAKYYFREGMRLEMGLQAADASVPGNNEDADSGGDEDTLLFEENLNESTPDSEDFNFDDAETPDIVEPEEPVAPEEPEESDSEEEGDDFDFSDFDLGGGDDDDFDFDFGEVEEKPKPKKQKVRKKKQRRKSSPKRTKKKAPKVAPQEEAESSLDEESSNQSEESGPSSPPTYASSAATTPEEAYGKALTYIEQVNADFSDYARSVYLRGLVQYALKDFEGSVTSFREVVRITHPKTGSVSNPALREMAFFSLARVHYQFEQFRYAIFYYDRITRDSESWLDALFEKSWAFFRLGSYERALGNLVTIQSPFFVEHDYPEGHILKAITYYENCRFKEAELFLKKFKNDYSAVVTELDRILEKQSTVEEFYAETESLKKRIKNGDDDGSNALWLTYQILTRAANDERLVTNQQSAAEIDSELARLQQIPAPYAGHPHFDALVKRLQERRDGLKQSSASVVVEYLAGERQSLRQLTSMLIRIQFEIAKQEKVSLEAELRGESQTVAIENYFYSTATDDERVYWPFSGEYWRDELGTYEYTLTKGCRPPEDE